VTIFATYFPYAISALATFILIVATNAGIIGGSRLMYSMSYSMQIPHHFRKLSRRFKTPYISIFTVSFLSTIILVFSKHLEVLADLYIFGSVVSFLLTHLSLIALRVKDRGIARPYKAPLNISIGKYEIPLSAILGVIFTSAVLVSIYALRESGRIFGIVWPLIGIPFYVYFRKKAHAPIFSAPHIEEVKFPEFQQPQIKTMLVCVKGIENSTMLFTACKLAKSFGAKMDVLYVVEVPQAIPVDEDEHFLFVEKPYIDELNRRVKAIGTENDMMINTLVYRSRSYDEVVKTLAPSYDLIVIGNTFKQESAFSKTVEMLIKTLNVPVLIYSYKIEPAKNISVVPLDIIRKVFKI
jgi:APA family basic amino acid/polyamine antiporter